MEQLDAVYEYIDLHREEVEAEYARILQREAEARAESERIFRERSPYPPDMPWEEKAGSCAKNWKSERRPCNPKMEITLLLISISIVRV